MSVTKTVELGEVDLDLMESVAKDMGYQTARNSQCRLYNSSEEADLVIRDICKGRDLGFRETQTGVKAVYDSEDAPKYSEVMAEYLERIVTRRSRGRFKVIGREKTGQKLVLNLRRV